MGIGLQKCSPDNHVGKNVVWLHMNVTYIAYPLHTVSVGLWVGVYRVKPQDLLTLYLSNHSYLMGGLGANLLHVINSKCLLRDGGLYPEVCCKMVQDSCKIAAR